MRLFLFLPVLLAVSPIHSIFIEREESSSASDFEDFFDGRSGSDPDARRIADPADPPRTAQEMMARFNERFMRFLAWKKLEDWDKLMDLVDSDAYIETCMESSYKLNMKQFYKWMSYLNSYYVEVGLKGTKMTGWSDTDVTTELVYRTEVRGGVKGYDTWIMSASFNTRKGHFMVNTLNMISDCKSIPSEPPLEPALSLDTFLKHLRTKLVDDIFLNEALRYKSAYESMYEYLSPDADINACDVGQMNPSQFVDYWNKRYGKIQVYQNHTYWITKNGKDAIVDFAFRYHGSERSYIRESYRFLIRKYAHPDVEYFESFKEWRITTVRQNCTESLTKMAKYDAALEKMSLAARRWTQLFDAGMKWDTHQAFIELFNSQHFKGNDCTKGNFISFQDFVGWADEMRKKYKVSRVTASELTDYKEANLSIKLAVVMTENNNSTSVHNVFLGGYWSTWALDEAYWRFSNLGYSCAGA
ncbi:unnamed protein product [Caenorhabditis sp. 36 PRJEB53466]|nr:unnamed protein product [Caenorhabditis sp. 36 PRJEB53466]